jgi:hypothetical protein
MSARTRDVLSVRGPAVALTLAVLLTMIATFACLGDGGTAGAGVTKKTTVF